MDSSDLLRSLGIPEFTRLGAGEEETGNSTAERVLRIVRRGDATADEEDWDSSEETELRYNRRVERACSEM